MNRPLVVQTEDLDAEAAAWLAERCEVVRCGPSEAGFESLLGRAQALVVRTYTRVDEALLSRGPALRVVGRAGVGLENIDVEACRRRGIAVVHTPESNSSAVAEYVFALMFDALRPRVYVGGGGAQGAPGEEGGPRACARGSLAVPSEGEWHELRRKYVAQRELNELVLGVWGLGRIGSAVARIAAGFQMQVIYNDLLEIAPARRSGAAPVSVDELLARSDVLSLHVDERPQNRGLLSSAALGKLKSNVLLINTSRGLVVDGQALAAFLRARPAAMAMLDVHDPEPIRPDCPLLDLPNAFLAPHLAAGTIGAKRRMSWVVREVWRVLEGRTASSSH
jgi:phosphoglycerate dehydrogenase-like enzyme